MIRLHKEGGQKLKYEILCLRMMRPPGTRTDILKVHMMGLSHLSWYRYSRYTVTMAKGSLEMRLPRIHAASNSVMAGPLSSCPMATTIPSVT